MINATYVDDVSGVSCSTSPSTYPINRYTKIHVLFRELARTKAPKGASNLSVPATKIKKFWKDFFGIDSLTDLSDKELHNLERFIKQRIKAENKKHD